MIISFIIFILTESNSFTIFISNYSWNKIRFVHTIVYSTFNMNNHVFVCLKGPISPIIFCEIIMMAKYSILVSRSINVISRKHPWYSCIYISSLQFIFIISLLKCICFQHIRSRHTFIPWLCWEKHPIHRSDIAPFLEQCFLVLPYLGTLFLSTKPNRHFPVGSIRSIDEEAYHAPDLSCSSSTSQQFLSFLKINRLFTYAFDMSPCLGSSWMKESLSVRRFVYFVFHIPDVFNTNVPFFSTLSLWKVQWWSHFEKYLHHILVFNGVLYSPYIQPTTTAFLW